MKRIALLFSIVLAAPAIAQGPPPPTAQLAEMKKLDFLIGRWKGDGWIEFGPQRRTFTETESVQAKQDGLLLLIEGLGKSKAAAGEPEKTAHEALAIVFYDLPTKSYRFHAYKAGYFTDIDFKVAEKGFEWGFPEPRSGSKIRFVMKLNEAGQWFETGEISQDGKTWHKFFEMTLQRVP